MRNQIVTRAEFERLQRQVDLLRAQVPVRFVASVASAELILMLMGQGNTLLTTPVSIKGVTNAGPLTAVPTAAPALATTYANGLGYAFLYNDDGTVSATRSWVFNGSITVNAVTTSGGLTTPLSEGNAFWVKNVFSVPITGGGGTTAPVYQVYKV